MSNHDKQYGNYTVQMALGGPHSERCKKALARAQKLKIGICEYIRQLVDEDLRFTELSDHY